MQARVYLVTNNLNGKQYVGQTVTKHSKHGHGHAIRAAYKKHGFNNFTYDVVCGGINNQKTLDFAEQFWINVMGSLAPNGYNLEGGGRWGKYVYHAPQLGKLHTDETKAKMSESQRKHWADNDAPMKGRKHSEETKAKMSAARTGRKQSDEERKMRSESIKMWHQNRKEQL